MKDGKANISGAKILRHLLIVAVFVLIAGAVSVPIWFVGIDFATDTVHTAQSQLSMAESDLKLINDFDPMPNTFGIVDKQSVAGGQQFGRLTSESADIDCAVYYGANRICMRAGAAASTDYSLPGYGSTTVLSGYNSTWFKNIDKLKKGDMLTLSTNWGQFTYRVTETAVKKSDESVDTMAIDREKLILFCTYPKTAFSKTENQRYYVFCEKASGPAVEVNQNEK